MNDPQSARADRLAAQYGVQETNPIGNIHELLDTVDYTAGVYPLANKDVVRIVRLRLIGCCRDYPFWDVSYCYGELTDGRRVRVDVGAYRIQRNYRRHLVSLAQQAGRFAKAMGLLDNVSTLAG